MADFGNLLGDLEVPPAYSQDEEETQVPLNNNDNEASNVVETQLNDIRPEIPEALLEYDRDHYNDDAHTNSAETMNTADDIVKKFGGTTSASTAMMSSSSSAQDEEYVKLKKLWVQELLSPELLPYDHDTVSLELELIHGQEELLDSMQQQEGTDNHHHHNPLAPLVAHICKMDLERCRYVASDLLQTRLDKLEAHALHNRELLDRMSEEEVSYLKSYGELLETHFRRTVLNHLPQEIWKSLDDPGMVASPNLNQYVFCKALEEVTIEEGGGSVHSAGSCLIARYETVQTLLMEGKMELLM